MIDSVSLCSRNEKPHLAKLRERFLGPDRLPVPVPLKDEDMSEKGKKVFVWKTLRIKNVDPKPPDQGPAGNAVKRLPRQYKWPTAHGSGALFPICGPDSQIQEALLSLTVETRIFFLPPLCQSSASVLMVMPAPPGHHISYQL